MSAPLKNMYREVSKLMFLTPLSLGAETRIPKDRIFLKKTMLGKYTILKITFRGEGLAAKAEI